MILFSEINLKWAAIDFTFIYDLVKSMYSEVGCLQDEINQGLDKPWKEDFST
ncbi:hypothetical protein [Peribacillus simplex]|uniref:hypothetical protein n=1 Tax=Peribacillus simplex TaxID=1478 RepID=UPI003D297B81